MAIDTEAKRRSALMLFGPSIMPDGAIATADRPAALWHYIGISIDSPAVDLTDLDPDSDPLDAVVH